MREQEPVPSYLYLLFGLSGLAALIYQIVWQRYLFMTFGTNAESVTLVVAAFMLGLGVGSLAGGEVSRRTSMSLVKLFAIAEAGIAVFGVFSSDVFAALNHALAGAPLLVAGVASFAVVVIPTTLMGATLPLLITHCVRAGMKVGESVSLLYFANTFGSAIACFLAAFLLLSRLGLEGATYAAACCNFVAAAAAYFVLRPSVTDEVAR